MALTATVIGTLAENPAGNENYTRWKVNVLGKKVTCFSSENASDKRQEFSSGDRVRVEGRPSWNEYQGEYSLTINGGVDLSDKADSLKLKADGTYEHELKIQKDEGGNYVHIKLESPTRKKDAQGEWFDDHVNVLTMALHPCVEKLKQFEADGITEIWFLGDLDTDPAWSEGSDDPGFYIEATEVGVSETRTESNFWGSKPKGLANRKAPAPVKKPAKKGNGGKDLNDEVPF